MKDLFKRLWREENGQDLTEYALLIVLIAMALVASIQPFASAISSVFSNAAANLAGAT
jgi:pilus assembly protein Flp/PilA